jgi:PAS domain S-box-containing protein
VEEELRERVEQLREREEHYRRIFESTSDGLIINDPATGRVVEANPAVCRMHGYSREEFLGIHATAFIHPDYHPVFAEFRETIAAGGTYQCEALDTRKDGTVFHVEVNGSCVMYGGRPHILAVVRDITERVQARELLQQRVEERTRELLTLLDVSRNMASTLLLQPLLGLILDQLKVVAPYSGAAIFGREGDDLVVLVRRSPGPDPQAGPTHYALSAAGLLWTELQAGKPLIINDLRGDSPLARAYQDSVGPHLETTFAFERSWLAVPMIRREQVIGIVTLSSNEVGYFTTHHAGLAMGIAQHAAIAIENARLYERAQEIAVLEERQRLSRELHDSVSQALYSIALGARTARTLLDRDPMATAEPLDFVLAQAERGLAEMRTLIFELRPEALEQEGLVGALGKQAEILRTREELTINLDLGAEPDAPLAVKEALYRIAQEAMQNVGKHAAATELRLSMRRAGDDIFLEIADNGRGFNPNTSFPGHLGLSTMRERAERMGGSLQVESRPGAGTTVRAAIPADGR